MNTKYIEQDAAIKLFSEKIYEACGNAMVNGLTYGRRLLDTISPADVKPVIRGEWIYSATYLFGGKEHKSFKCSECGCKMLDADEVANFCPNCGAEMRRGG